MTGSNSIITPTIVWAHRRSFFMTMGMTFALLAIIVFTLPRQLTIVRTSIDLGTVEIGTKQEALDQPEMIIRRITSVYGPVALAEMEKSGIPRSTIAALRLPDIELTGASVQMRNIVDQSLDSETKGLQQRIADQVVNALAPRAEAIHKAHAARIAFAKETTNSLAHQVDAFTRELSTIDAINESCKTQIEHQQIDLSKQTLDTAGGRANDGAAIEAKLRLTELTTKQLALSIERSKLVRELGRTRQQYMDQQRSIADAQLEENTIRVPHVSLPTLSLPLAKGSRWLGLFFLAFVASVLVAFGTVALLHNVSAANS